MKKVGFIGLGIMGKPMALNLIKAGFPLTVYNRTAKKAEELVEKGAVLAKTCREVAEKSDVIITMVSDTPDVLNVLFGENSAAAGLRKGSTVIDMSTVSPDETKEMAGRIRALGSEMLDCPVSGGESGAIEAALTIMVGGNESVFEQNRDILEAFGKKITYMGENGAGQAAKLGNQVAAVMTLVGICESMKLADKLGLDLEKFMSALSGGSAQSFLLTNLGPKIITGDFAPGFLVGLIQKDLKLVLEAAAGLNLAMPGTALAAQLYNSVAAQDGGKQMGHQALYKAFDRLTQ